jgi:deoxycytidylate deaminase
VINWDEYLAYCDRFASVNLCTHRDVGALILHAGEIVSYGRNTMPGHDACVLGGCPRGQAPRDNGKPDYSDCVAVHAEMNAIIKVGPVLRRGSTLVVNSVPCHLCTRLARGAELWQIVYRHWSGETRIVRLQ